MNPVAADDHLARARALYNARRYDLAVTAALDAIAANPNDAGSFVILSFSYDRLGRMREAEAAARNAIELDPARAQATLALGLVRLSQRRFRTALRHFNEALRLDPQSDDAYRLGAIARMNMRQYQAALQMIDRALDIDPDVISAHEVRAIILRLLGRITEAEAETAAVLSMAPESVLGLSQEGLLQLKRGDGTKARETFREALRLDPNSSSVRAGFERVIVESSSFASLSGRGIVIVAMCCFFCTPEVSRVSADFAFALLATGFMLLIVNQPIANEALRAHDIGRTFLSAPVLARNRVVLAYAALGEAALLAGAAFGKPELFAMAVACMFAALAAARSTHTVVGLAVRRWFAGIAPVIAVSGIVADVALICSQATRGDTRVALETVAIIVANGVIAGVAVYFVLELFFVLPARIRAWYRSRVRK